MLLGTATRPQDRENESLRCLRLPSRFILTCSHFPDSFRGGGCVVGCVARLVTIPVSIAAATPSTNPETDRVKTAPCRTHRQNNATGTPEAETARRKSFSAHKKSPPRTTKGPSGVPTSSSATVLPPHRRRERGRAPVSAGLVRRETSAATRTAIPFSEVDCGWPGQRAGGVGKGAGGLGGEESVPGTTLHQQER